MDEIVQLASQNPTREFGNRELRSLTGYAGPSVTKSLNLLKELGFLCVRTEGNRTLYRINSDLVHDPKEPLLAIRQEEFRRPIVGLVERLTDELDSVVGILVFGSVARGVADRSSDIDCLVLVEDDVVRARRVVQEVVNDLQQQRFDGDRYEFEVLVESIRTGSNRGEELRPIFQEGVTIHETKALDRVREAVFSPKRVR